VIQSNVPEAGPGELIDAYRNRMEIERSFRNLKGFVEIRPLYPSFRILKSANF